MVSSRYTPTTNRSSFWLVFTFLVCGLVSTTVATHPTTNPHGPNQHHGGAAGGSSTHHGALPDHHAYSTVRDCPRIPLGSCDDLMAFGPHHAEECQCVDEHGEGAYTCRISPEKFNDPNSNHGLDPSVLKEQNGVWCHGKLSKTQAFLAKETQVHHGGSLANFDHGNDTSLHTTKENEQAKNEKARAAQAKKDGEQRQKQMKLAVLIAGGGFIVVILLTAGIGRHRSIPIRQASLDGVNNNYRDDPDPAGGEKDEDMETGTTSTATTQVELATFA